MLATDRYKTYDHVMYDMTVPAQKSAYTTMTGYMDNVVVCTKYIANGNYREYKATSLTGDPTHPVKTDFGYENLKTGSLFYVIDTSKTYMYDEFTDAWVEQT